jgi:hypothetical protein
MQTTGTAQDASRYQETLQRVRWLVPFVDLSQVRSTGLGSERWSFLAERHRATAGGTAPSEGLPANGSQRTAPSSSAVLLLRTLFGFNMWGNLSGLELLEREPTYTTDIPAGILFACPASSTRWAGFPEDFDCASLVLIWEWFLLEVAGAAPPAVLWATVRVS